MRFSTRDCGTQMWKKVRIWHTSPLPKCKNIFTTTYGNLDCTYLTEKVWPNFICDFSRRMNQIFLWSFFPQQHLPQRSKTTFNPQKKFLIIIKVKLHSGQDGFQKDVFNPWLIPFHQKFRNFTNNTVTWLFKPQKSTSFTWYLDTQSQIHFHSSLLFLSLPPTPSSKILCCELDEKSSHFFSKLHTLPVKTGQMAKRKHFKKSFNFQQKQQFSSFWEDKGLFSAVSDRTSYERY